MDWSGWTEESRKHYFIPQRRCFLQSFLSTCSTKSAMFQDSRHLLASLSISSVSEIYTHIQNPCQSIFRTHVILGAGDHTSGRHVLMLKRWSALAGW
jgi:hypothetical protein